MDDKELLELDLLAAKAAGYEVEVDRRLGYDRILLIEYGRQGGVYKYEWRPRYDNGDAFRLAVTLGATIEGNILGGGVLVEVETNPAQIDSSVVRAEEMYGQDPYAATRLCIVRAAASLGREGKA